MPAHFDLVILIDCWELSGNWVHGKHRQGVNEFYKRITDRLVEYDFKNVVLASYDRPGDYDRQTAKWLLDNIRSNNHVNANLKIRNCNNMVEVFREFPESSHSGLNVNNDTNSVNILICGQSWQVCTHWRPLGFINWIMQGQTVFTHPDVVWHTGQPAFDHFVLEEDPRIEWHAAEPNTFESWSLGTSDTIIESPCFYAKELKWDLPNEVPPSTLYHRRET
jgi:hypothetical protein|tara:strand:- start:49 stop:711 length:663 start_codon:yes stop_codon:yes gene_type:complete